MFQRLSNPKVQPLMFSQQSFSQNNNSKLSFVSPQCVRSYAQSPKFDCRKAMKEHNQRKRRHQESIRKYDQCNKLIVSRAYEECERVERESVNGNLGLRTGVNNGRKVIQSDKQNEYSMVTRSGDAFHLNNQGKTHGSVAKFQNDLRNGNLLQNSPYYNNGFTGQASTPIQRSSCSKRNSQQHEPSSGSKRNFHLNQQQSSGSKRNSQLYEQRPNEDQLQLEQLRKENHYLHIQNSELTHQLRELGQGVLHLEKALGQRQETYSKLKEISPGFTGLWMMNDYEEDVTERSQRNSRYLQEQNAKELSYMEGDKHTRDTIELDSEERISLNNKYYHTDYNLSKNHNRQSSFQPKSILDPSVNTSLNSSPITQLQQKFSKILNNLKLSKSTSQQSLRELSHLQQKLDSLRSKNTNQTKQAPEQNIYLSTNYKPNRQNKESLLTRVKSQDRFRF